MAINKVVYGNNTLLDLTEDTVTEEDVLEGKTFHDKSGQKRTGSATQGGRVQDVEVNGESVVNAQGVAEVLVPVIDDEDISNESVYSSEKIEDRLDEYVDKDAGEEKLATTEFETINGGLLSSLKVSLSPNQDLHGYDHPWVGGAGANKWDEEWRNGYYQLGTQESNYGQFVPFANAVANKNPISVLPSTNYTMCVESGGSGSIFYYDSNQNVISHTLFYTSPFSFTTPANCAYINFNMNQNPYGATYKNDIALNYPSTVTTYSPYSNICPITGHTEAKAMDNGKNLFKVTATSQTINGVTFTVHDDGSVTVNGTSNDDIGFILGSLEDLVVGTSYICSSGATGGSTLTYFINIAGAGSDANSFTFTHASNFTACRIYIRNNVTLNNVVFKPMIRLASDTDPTFAPYNGYRVTVNLGGTYYSGTLDIVTGVFTPDMAGVDLGTLTWIVYGGDRFLAQNQMPDVKIDADYRTPRNAICSQYIWRAGDALYNNPDAGFSYYIESGFNKLFIKDMKYSDVDDFKTAMSGVMLVYEIANPTPIQLSPTMVKALVGENHLSAPLEGQEITEVKYKEIFVFGDVLEVIGEDYFTLPLQTFTFTNKVCNVNDDRVTSNSLVDVYFTSDSMSSVEDAGITVESQNGKIVMTAEEQPVGTIQGRVKVVN